ncbi:hypothetical protein KEM54_000377 [Ascosphaera aggregata]|nr:hypothetical protein KEM54_000377 [Ascosphaera aggregata]
MPLHARTTTRLLAYCLRKSPMLNGPGVVVARKAVTRLFPYVVARAPHSQPLRQLSCSSDDARLVSAAELKFGQPLHETHPHILNAGELTKGISAQEYYDRREKLASRLPRSSVALISAAETTYKSGSVFYPFHQDSDFFYLTGFNEPGAVAIIGKLADSNIDGPGHLFHLFCREKNERLELWEGTRSGTQAAVDVFNADEGDDISSLEGKLPSLLRGASSIYTNISLKRLPQAEATRWERILGQAVSKLQALRPKMNELRVCKSSAEITNMRIAGRQSGRAFTEAMKMQFDKERDLYTFIEYKFKMNGCDDWAFVPVVAGGKNALGIHYTRNDDILHDGELICVDAGGEYGNYITDITRTWPINGKFSAAQKELYSALLDSQRWAINQCHEKANRTLDELHDATEERLKKSLTDLGFQTEGNAMRTLFPHHLGHHIGLDVHDCPGYSRGNKLKKNHCITIEPGIYVPDDDRWPKHFRGIGMRIEDSVCVGEEDPLILSTEAVKEVDDIEALR